MQIALEPHPLLRVAAFTTTFRAPLGEVAASARVLGLLQDEPTAPAGLARDEELRGAVRDMLRYGGYKPTGRGKPASEYLVRAAAEGALGSINAAVDACNAVSLHTGLPITVIDLDRATPPFRIAIAPAGASYVFNPAGQEIDLAGLVCLLDGDGPCGNAVKDAQRTKTGPATTRTLSIVWAPAGHEARLAGTEAWYRELLDQPTASVEIVHADAT